MFLHEPATQATDPRVSDPSKRSCCAVETPDREGGRVNPGPTSAAYDAETPLARCVTADEPAPPKPPRLGRLKSPLDCETKERQ